MSKVKSFLFSINFSLVVLLMVVSRVAVFGASIGEALAVVAVCGLYGFNKWLDSKKPQTVNEQLQKDLMDIKSTVSNLLIKQSVKPSTPLNPDIKRFF